MSSSSSPNNGSRASLCPRMRSQPKWMTVVCITCAVNFFAGLWVSVYQTSYYVTLYSLGIRDSDAPKQLAMNFTVVSTAAPHPTNPTGFTTKRAKPKPETNKNPVDSAIEDVFVTPKKANHTEIPTEITIQSTTEAVEKIHTEKTEEGKKTLVETPPNDMTIVILSMDRFDSLRRLLRSLVAAEYPQSPSPASNASWVGREHKIDLVIRFDRPSKFVVEGDKNNNTSSSNRRAEEESWKNGIRSVAEWIEREWDHGTTSVTISDTNIGLAQAWFSAWEPTTNFDRALILEDDIEVSPLYYMWLSAAHDHYGYGYHDADNATASTVVDEYGYDAEGRFHSPRPKISDLASFGLSRQTLVPLRKDYKKSKLNARMFPSDQPFLYALLGSHGFSPMAHVWTEFLEFVKCSNNFNKFVGKCTTLFSEKKKRPKQPGEIDISIPELVTSDWYKKKKRSMWTQHFVFFCYEKQLYNLYRHTPPSSAKSGNKAFVTHWKEKGAHFDGKQATKDHIQPLLQFKDIEKSSPSIMDFPPSSTLKRYDFGANHVTMVGHLDSNESNSSSRLEKDSQVLPPLIMSAAIGYSLKDFENFVGSLRKHYFGVVWLLISKGEDSESVSIRGYLDEHNVRYLETDAGSSGHMRKGGGWEQINRDRFRFFSSVCDPNLYSLCLTTDFRDSVFQSNPFANIDRLLLPSQPFVDSMETLPFGILHVFEHDKDMTVWHYDKMKDKKCHLYEDYGTSLEGTKIINGGSMIGSPLAFQRLEEYMTVNWKGCNDQVILNVLVRGNVLTSKSTTTNATETTGSEYNSKRHQKPITVKVYQQGYGPLNVLGHGGMVLKNKQGKLMNRNCIVAPAVHQYDLVRCSNE